MDKSSYDMFCYLHSNGKAFLDAFNIQYIDPKNVTLKPSLLKRKKIFPELELTFTNSTICIICHANFFFFICF